MSTIKRNCYKGTTIGIFTSGGDSQGMNATVRACVRMALYVGCQPYLIHEGYQGMINGGEHFVKADWVSVSSIIHSGGTVIGSARCMEFLQRSGRLKAAENLIRHGISRLIVIGGDGSLTGANLFRQEWSSLLDELLKERKITPELIKEFSTLNIVGLVGSIDNDFCGTDMTIGTDSALHRIVEAIDAISSTASSHQRCFIMEVMGRNCGYLSIVAGIVSEADFVFCPESPPPLDWPDKLCKKLTQERSAGHRLNIVILSEGAIDLNGKPITASDVKNVIVDVLNLDARITVLGHVQRGGNASAYDRILGCRLGCDATLAVLEATSESIPVVVGIEGNEVNRVPLMESVERTKAVATAMAEKNWDLAVKLRGLEFEHNLKCMKMLSRSAPVETNDDVTGFRIGIIHIGWPSCGMNAAVRCFVRNGICNGHKMFGISDGVEGLIDGKIEPMTWGDVNRWAAEGGAFLGASRTMPEKNFNGIAARLREFQIKGVLIIGGFEAFKASIQFYAQRCNYPEFCIPIAVIPATMSNNVPGTEYTIGCDTSLNEVTEICDRLRNSARGSGQQVMVIETMGGFCGYLPTLAGIAGGVDCTYIYEEPFTIKDMQEDVAFMKLKMAAGVQRGLVLLSQGASKYYDCAFIHKLYAAEGEGLFRCNKNILGQEQQGGSPTASDRAIATIMASKCSEWFNEKLQLYSAPGGKITCNSKETVCLIGLVGYEYRFTPVADLIDETIFEKRIPKNQCYLKLRPYLKILSRHSEYGDDEKMELINPVDVNCRVN